MKKWLLSLLILIQPALANEESELYTITLGETTFNIPTPKGMIRITPEMIEPYLYAEQMNAQDSGNQYYANYVDLNALIQGKEQNCSISTSKKMIHLQMSAAQIKELKHIFETQFSSLLNSSEFIKEIEEIEQNRINVNPETTGMQFLGTKIISIDKIFEDDNSYFFLVKKSTTVRELDKIQTEYEVSTGGMFVVNNKLLNLACFAEADEQGEQWVKETLLDWQKNIVQSNQQNLREKAWQRLLGSIAKDN